MGQEISMMCPVCKERRATYKDKFKAFCPDFETFVKFEKEYPPFEKYLGPDCLKYMYETPLIWHRDEKEPYVFWLFYSCDICILINDPYRKQKFTEHNPNGITLRHSRLP